MNDLILRPLPIRQIKNNNVRRIVMVVMFIPLISMSIIVNGVWMPFRFLISIVHSITVLTQSLAEFWNEPEKKVSTDEKD